MSRANRKRKNRGEPLKYKSKNINWSAVDYAIEVEGKYFYGHTRKLLQIDVNKYKSLFLSFVAERKERKEEFRHRDAVDYALNLIN